LEQIREEKSLLKLAFLLHYLIADEAHQKIDVKKELPTLTLMYLRKSFVRL